MATESEATEIEPAAAAERVILVVDDDRQLCDLVVGALAECGHRVEAAGDRREALAAAAGLPRLDLLISDVNVPGAGGRQLAAEIGLRHPNARVLYMSGFSPATVGAEGIDTGAETFLPKPFSIATLLDTIEQLLDPSSGSAGAEPEAPPPSDDGAPAAGGVRRLLAARRLRHQRS